MASGDGTRSLQDRGVAGTVVSSPLIDRAALDEGKEGDSHVVTS